MKRIGFLVMILFFTGILSGVTTPATSGAAPHLLRKPEPRPDHVGRTLIERARAAARAKGLAYAPATYPQGVDILFLRVDFQDERLVTDWSVCYPVEPASKNGDPDPATTGLGVWTDYSDYWVNSAKDRFPEYYLEASHNNLQVRVTVSSTIYRLPKPMCYYGRETNKDLENLIIDAVNLAEPDITFSLYDAVLIIHAGAGEESDVFGDSTGDLWSLSYSTGCIDRDRSTEVCEPLPKLKGDADFNEFIVMPQTGIQDRISSFDPFGVYVHEFGHWLGLPDLYDTSLFSYSDGIGRWGLMGSGTYNGDPAGSSPANLDAWSKAYLGWVAPTEIAPGTDEGLKTLRPIWNDATQVIKIPATTQYPSKNQYFLLENRRKAGYDTGLPGEGLLVWLVDQDYIDANIAWNTVNIRARGVRLIEADGKFNLLDGADPDMGSARDPFPGATNNQNLTPLTTPSSVAYVPYAILNLKDIIEDSVTGDVLFFLGLAPAPPDGIAIVSKSIVWQSNSEPDFRNYHVYKNGIFAVATSAPLYLDKAVGNGDTYRVTAVDNGGNESEPSRAVSNDGKEWCFIATAAYGSSLDRQVVVLRGFRDRYLMTSAGGRLLVALYYRYSPPLARMIARHEGLRAAARWVLTPMVYAVAYPAMMGMGMLLFGVGVGILRGASVRRSKVRQVLN